MVRSVSRMPIYLIVHVQLLTLLPKEKLPLFVHYETKILYFFPIRRGIRSFPLQACTQLCFTDAMERYSSSLWPDLFITQIPLCTHMPKPLVLHRTIQISAAQDSLKNSFSIKIIQATTPGLELEERQHFRKPGL